MASYLPAQGGAAAESEERDSAAAEGAAWRGGSGKRRKNEGVGGLQQDGDWVMDDCAGMPGWAKFDGIYK